jgi:hypothetical protein
MGTTKCTVVILGIICPFRLSAHNCAGQINEEGGRKIMGEEREKVEMNNLKGQRENRETKKNGKMIMK